MGNAPGIDRVRPVSAAFLDAVTRSHTLAIRADLLLGGVTAIQGLPINAGSVTLDRTAAIRGTCNVTIAAPELVPATAFDPLTPFGAELQLWRGVQLSTGPELASLGIFGIQDLTTDAAGSSMQISGLDRAQRVVDAAFEGTEIVAAGTNYGAAIQDLIAAGVPGLTYRFDATDEVTPLLVYTPDSDGRWAAAQAMAATIGFDLNFDGDGALVFAAVPDPTATPVATLTDGPGGVIVTATKKWDRAPAYNAVVAVSSNPGTPVSAVARDLDPTSPTYYFGPFGRKPLQYSAPFTTVTQAQNAANAKLRSLLGVTQSLDLAIVPNPAYEPGDILGVQRLKLAVNEVDVLDSLTISLDATSGAMTAGVRARQIAA